MHITIIGPSGSGKTTLAAELARTAGFRHVELDALYHGPNWEPCSIGVLRERVAAATEGDDWITDSTYHTLLGDFVVERVDLLVWLDLPLRVVLWRLLRRTHLRNRDKVELWNGNVEPGWRESLPTLIWPAFKRVFENRRALPARYADVNMRRLRSDAANDCNLTEVRLRRGAFCNQVSTWLQSLDRSQSIHPTARMSGSSNRSERQKTPPFTER
jgi:adenylate kinase family enzyme